jgi:lipoyl-dependent peroxiredoxin
MKQSASAQWKGSLKEGSGILSTGSGALIEKPYSFKTRFEGEQGTNPEGLIGAAHAGCFSMAFSMILGDAGFTPDKIETTASHLDVTATIPGIDDATFQDLAAKGSLAHALAKAGPLVLGRRITSHGMRSFYVTVRRSQGISDGQIAAEIGDRTGPSIIASTYGSIPPDWQGRSGPDMAAGGGRFCVGWSIESGPGKKWYKFWYKGRNGGLRFCA